MDLIHYWNTWFESTMFPRGSCIVHLFPSSRYDSSHSGFPGQS
ncbi:hypothetical protein T11_8444 [Trichinella zimbabwensis]|uniref:Uncharacterized protein n=1 Tax=Trichinella zimbabwensis TaxID=268475 RepID=A0A0V1G939_9BILA|nr:hypothetical protein T11_8444 [Trichinella zimbabwensis]